MQNKLATSCQQLLPSYWLFIHFYSFLLIPTSPSALPLPSYSSSLPVFIIISNCLLLNDLWQYSLSHMRGQLLLPALPLSPASSTRLYSLSRLFEQFLIVVCSLLIVFPSCCFCCCFSSCVASAITQHSSNVDLFHSSSSS